MKIGKPYYMVLNETTNIIFPTHKLLQIIKTYYYAMYE
jgi:hypothetical protein